MSKNKRAHGIDKQSKKGISIDNSTDSLYIVWAFDKLDKNGAFSFNISEPDFNAKLFLEKIISYSNMTWAQVKQQTHDGGKSKHHELDFDKLSKDAKNRYFTMGFSDEDTDKLFSFAFTNLLRVIGVRDGQIFHPIWYDKDHKFCPSKK